MKFKYLIPLLVLFSCQNHENKEIIPPSPLVVVIKYISAENCGDTIEAKKYIDIEKTFHSYIDSQNVNAHAVWINQMVFLNNLGNDKKYTNNFKFHNYEFVQEIKDRKAKITFVAKKQKAKIQSIEYTLEFTKEGIWIIDNIALKKTIN